MEKAEAALMEQLQKVVTEKVPDYELQKVKNKTESMIAFEDMSVMSRAASLAYYELLGDASWMNEELNKYAEVTSTQLQQEAQRIFRPENSNTIYYYATH
jgi:predicted Zn-dependent peptidase